ncbi:MAG: NAD-dependent epimerase/dehydratase family protein [Verrucomicrobia bacterium]|nr:NAD-dependent epimerase/dehydratase family protein [Verrucomicrobiota bacterium]
MRVAVTGAFGYSGRYIAARLLEAGHDVLTLTHSPGRANPFGDRVRAFPFHFEAPARLRRRCAGPTRSSTRTGCGLTTGSSTTRRR